MISVLMVHSASPSAGAGDEVGDHGRVERIDVFGVGRGVLAMEPLGDLFLHLAAARGDGRRSPACTTAGPTWMRSPSWISASLPRSRRPLSIVPLVLPRSARKIRPSRRSMAAWSLLTIGEPSRSWQSRCRPMTNRGPTTGTGRPLLAPIWTISQSPGPSPFADESSGRGRPGIRLVGGVRGPSNRAGAGPPPRRGGGSGPVVRARRMSTGSVRGLDGSGPWGVERPRFRRDAARSPGPCRRGRGRRPAGPRGRRS